MPSWSWFSRYLRCPRVDGSIVLCIMTARDQVLLAKPLNRSATPQDVSEPCLGVLAGLKTHKASNQSEVCLDHGDVNLQLRKNTATLLGHA